MKTKTNKEKAVKPATTPFWEGSPVVKSTYNRLIVLWIVALLVAGAQFFAAYRWLRPNVMLGDGRPQWLLIALAVLALGEFIGSIWLWRGIQLEAAAKRDLKLSQLGYLAAWLLCLAAGPLGFVIALSDDARYYYGFIILAALGVLYHQPAKETLGAAASKSEAKPQVAETVAASEPPAPDDTPPQTAEAEAYFSDSEGGSDVAEPDDRSSTG